MKAYAKQAKILVLSREVQRNTFRKYYQILPETIEQKMDSSLEKCNKLLRDVLETLFIITSTILYRNSREITFLTRVQSFGSKLVVYYNVKRLHQHLTFNN